jgi:hypothetical protein
MFPPVLVGYSDALVFVHCMAAIHRCIQWGSVSVHLLQYYNCTLSTVGYLRYHYHLLARPNRIV